MLRGGAAEQAGLAAGDEILALRGWRIRRLDDAVRLLDGEAEAPLLVARDQRVLTLPLTLPSAADERGRCGRVEAGAEAGRRRARALQGMARRLSAIGWALPSPRRRVQFAALVLAVIAMHGCVTRSLAERMASFAIDGADAAADRGGLCAQPRAGSAARRRTGPAAATAADPARGSRPKAPRAASAPVATAAAKAASAAEARPDRRRAGRAGSGCRRSAPRLRTPPPHAGRSAPEPTVPCGQRAGAAGIGAPQRHRPRSRIERMPAATGVGAAAVAGRLRAASRSIGPRRPA